MPQPPAPDPDPPPDPWPAPSAALGPPGLPPPFDRVPPGRRGPSPLPPWLDAVRQRAGLDVRVGAWIAVALVAVLVGLWLLRPAPPPVEETLPMASTSDPAAADPSAGATGAPGDASSTSSVPPADVVVHAAGAVARPGVYTLEPSARVDDLVRAAGGLAPDADGARINLAAPLADGARVYVPHLGELDPPPVVGPDQGAPADAGPAPPGEDDGPPAPIDLNTATEAELDELPGVGPAIAAAIVAFREENGGFTTVEDLLDVRGIGEAKLAEISPLVTV